MRIELITIGDELLDGRVVDTNAAWLAGALRQRGWIVSQHTTVPDDVDAIRRILNDAAQRAELCICTGGLGPTPDDVTAEAAALAVGAARRVDEEALRHVRARLGARPLTDAQMNQCTLPETAEVHTSPVGTAPSFRIRLADCSIYCLPGVPTEVRQHAQEWIFPHLEMNTPTGGHLRRLVTSGAGESRIAELIKFDTLPPDIHVGFRSGILENEVVLSSSDEALLNQASAIVRDRLGQFYLGDGVYTLADATLRTCRRAGLTLSTAESCTGGLIGAELTAVPGSSDVFLGAIVSYSNTIKMEQLGVRNQTLQTHGAVSEACALEMAAGARSRLSSQITVAVTGVAGPDGGSPSKPVGTVCIAWLADDWRHVETCHFRGDRNMVRLRTVGRALDVIRRQFYSE
ncbi:MAG: CinA family nicotinamide mononucleotide deamidase-related protein [Myxococcota bacterium]|nr:CinA family nicotinamide mononucleotide deamidase-related protein [Myxococcota bacterium]